MSTPNADYVRQLEEAVNALSGWMPMAEAKEIEDEQPELAALCLQVHTKLDHPEIPGRLSIFGRERAVLDKIAAAIHRGLRGPFESNDLLETKYGSTFDVATTIDGDRFVARVTIDLLPPQPVQTDG